MDETQNSSVNISLSSIPPLMPSLPPPSSTKSSPSPMESLVPTDIIKYNILPYLSASSLLSLRRASHSYCTLLSRECNFLWKDLHSSRWIFSSAKTRKYIKRFEFVLTKGEEKEEEMVDDDGNIVPAPFFDYRIEYARRHTLDSSIQKKLLPKIVKEHQFCSNFQSPNEDPIETWSIILKNGLDIVDALCDLYEKSQDKKERKWIQKILAGINRCELFLEWRNLILCDRYWCNEHRVVNAFGRVGMTEKKNVKRDKGRSREDNMPMKPHIEDGAILLSKFYQTSLDLINTRNKLAQKQKQEKQQDDRQEGGKDSGDEDATLKKPKTMSSTMVDEIEQELNSLANLLLSRLQWRKERLVRTTTKASSNTGNSSTAKSDDEFPIDWILEEMQYFFVSEEDNQQRSVPRGNHNDPFADIGDIIVPNSTIATSSTASTSAAAAPQSASSTFRPFSGNTSDYYKHTNSLLHHVLLKSRKGIPITLCIIYASIVRRAVNITLDPIGLPGHFVLGTPWEKGEERKFIDVYKGGKVLTLSDCQRFVMENLGHVTWRNDYAAPVTYEEVWQRIVRNLLNCHSRSAWEEDLNGGTGVDEDENGGENADETLGPRMGIAIRFLLNDVLFRITMSSTSSLSSSLYVTDMIKVVGGEDEDEEVVDMLTKSPPMNPQFC